MKKVILSVFLLLVVSQCAFAANETIEQLIAALEGKEPEVIAQETKQRQDVEWAKKEIEAVKKNLRFKTDKIENITWTHTKLIPSTPYFDVYCGERNGSVFLKLIIKPDIKTEQMAMERVIINVDGIVQSFTVPLRYRNITSEVSSSKGINGVKMLRWYTERIDMPVYQEVQDILRQAASGKETLVRMSGRYNQDFKLSKAAHNAFDSLLRYYKARQIILASQS